MHPVAPAVVEVEVVGLPSGEGCKKFEMTQHIA